MVIMGIFKRLFSTLKIKNNQMNLGMSLFLFYVYDYANESKMQLKFPSLATTRLLLF